MKSKKFRLNKKDIKDQLHSAFVWLAPLGILYVAQLSGSLAEKKVLGFADLVPNLMTISAIQLYFVNQLFGLFRKAMAGK